MDNTVRDKMWLWGHQVDSHYGGYHINKHSRMTAAEAGMYLGISNLMMVDLPEPYRLMPSRQEAMAISKFKRVIWSIRHSQSLPEEARFDEGQWVTNDLKRIHDTADKYGNVYGVIMDDFQVDMKRPDMSPDVIRQLRESIRSGHENMGLYVVAYTYLFELPYWEYLQHCDAVTLWTWKSEDLREIDRNLQFYADKIADKPVLLGLYMYDYGANRPMPLDMMKYQCEFALRQLRSGRISGMVFLASCICDLGFEAVEWARQWIDKVGDITL